MYVDGCLLFLYDTRAPVCMNLKVQRNSKEFHKTLTISSHLFDLNHLFVGFETRISYPMGSSCNFRSTGEIIQGIDVTGSMLEIFLAIYNSEKDILNW